LLLYFPLVLLSLWGLFGLLRTRRATVLPAIVFAGALLFAAAAWWAWDGTFGWGPRLLLPAVPLLAAAAAVAPAPPLVFRVLFALGVAVNGLAALQPSTLTTWTYRTLARRALTPEEAARYPDFALDRAPDGRTLLYPQYFASGEAALAPIPLVARLLFARLRGAGTAGLDAALWKGEPAPSTSLADALPASDLVHFTAPFRWPHLGMSLARKKTDTDWSLAYVEALLDQANRAQDMGRPDRAVDFGERLFAELPNPRSAARGWSRTSWSSSRSRRATPGTRRGRAPSCPKPRRGAAARTSPRSRGRHCPSGRRRSGRSGSRASAHPGAPPGRMAP
jgi:hypothetical protein